MKSMRPTLVAIFFYDLFLQGLGGAWPSRPATGVIHVTYIDMFCLCPARIRSDTGSCRTSLVRSRHIYHS